MESPDINVVLVRLLSSRRLETVWVLTSTSVTPSPVCPSSLSHGGLFIIPDHLHNLSRYSTIKDIAHLVDAVNVMAYDYYWEVSPLLHCDTVTLLHCDTVTLHCYIPLIYCPRDRDTALTWTCSIWAPWGCPGTRSCSGSCQVSIGNIYWHQLVSLHHRPSRNKDRWHCVTFSKLYFTLLLLYFSDINEKRQLFI